jgi:hypothetical protein
LDRTEATEAEEAVVEWLSRDPASLTASLSGAAFAEAQAAAAAADVARREAAGTDGSAADDDTDTSVAFSAKNGGLASLLGGTQAGNSISAMEAMKTSTGLEPQPWMSDAAARRAALRSVKPPPGILFVPLASVEQCQFDAHRAAQRAVKEAEQAAAPSTMAEGDAAPTQALKPAAAPAVVDADSDDDEDEGPPGYAGPSGCFLASETYSDLAVTLAGLAPSSGAQRSTIAHQFLAHVGRAGDGGKVRADGHTGSLTATAPAADGTAEGSNMLATLASVPGANSGAGAGGDTASEAAKVAKIWTDLEGQAAGPDAAKQALLARSELRRRAREAAKRIGV